MGIENFLRRVVCILCIAPVGIGASFAQGDAKAGARLDANQIVVGDQARLFIQVQNNPSLGRLQWATIPDSFNNLEIVERGKIDTTRQGDIVTYRQRLLITGFDSGVFKIPAFVFPVIPNTGAAYTVQTDSFGLLVQTVEVDTTKGFKGIKGIVYVKSNWLDYIWFIVGGGVYCTIDNWAHHILCTEEKRAEAGAAGTSRIAAGIYTAVTDNA